MPIGRHPLWREDLPGQSGSRAGTASRLLMLDEPLSGLERPLHEQLLTDIRELLASLGQTALCPTNDLQEVLAVSDRVTMMRAGRIEQVADAVTIYRVTATEFVACFLRLTNILPLIPTPTLGLLRTALGDVCATAGRDSLAGPPPYHAAHAGGRVGAPCDSRSATGEPTNRDSHPIWTLRCG